MGDADGPVAGDQPFAVKRPVALKGGAVGVEFPAVELDDQAGGGPEAVDLVAEDEDVGGGCGEAVLSAELGKALLQWGARLRRRPDLAEEASNGPQRSSSRPRA